MVKKQIAMPTAKIIIPIPIHTSFCPIPVTKKPMMNIPTPAAMVAIPENTNAINTASKAMNKVKTTISKHIAIGKDIGSERMEITAIQIILAVFLGDLLASFSYICFIVVELIISAASFSFFPPVRPPPLPGSSPRPRCPRSPARVLSHPAGSGLPEGHDYGRNE